MNKHGRAGMTGAGACSDAPLGAGAGVKDEQAPRLRLQQLAVAAGDIRLLENIDFELHAGELVALTGPSGCGKTTLLRAICGLEDPAAGQVLLRGRLAEAIGWPQFRRSVVLVEQRPVLFDTSVEANLRRPFTYRACGSPFPAERAQALLHRLGIGAHRLRQNARSLSVGQQQRLCLIRALLLDPLVLLLDEPTSALDRDAVADVEDLIREQAEQRGLAALIVTHDRAQADGWCHRRFDLSAHRVACSGP
jgi:putative ABC transport system ATP-binding protein